MAMASQASSPVLMRDIGMRGMRDNGALKVGGRCLELDRFVVRSGSQRHESTLRGGVAEEEVTDSVEDWRREAADGVRRAVSVALASVVCFGVAAGGPIPETETGDVRGGASFFDVASMVNVGVRRAHASGLLQMPPVRLVNRYYLVRAGESTFETRGLINTNPVAKTSMDSGLSEEGKKQTVQAAKGLRELGACDDNCWIWPSITQRAYQTAEIIAYVNNINRSRIVPEYSFLDARGLGAYEGRGFAAANEVYDIDALSSNLRPPPYSDGTPNESVADVFVRVTLETQYFNETIVIVAPDSDNLSVLEAGLTGLDLRRHRELAYGPGEVRFVDAKRLPPPRKSVSGYVKCTQTAEVYEDLVNENVSRDRGFRAFSEMMGTLVILFVLSPQLAPVLGILMLSISAIVAIYKRTTMQVFKAHGMVQARIIECASETFSAIRTVRPFGGERRQTGMFDEMVLAYQKSGDRLGWLKSTNQSWTRVAIYISLMALYVLGGTKVKAGELAIGTMVSFIGYTFTLTFAVQGFVNTLVDLQGMLAAVKRINGIVGRAEVDEWLAHGLEREARGELQSSDECASSVDTGVVGPSHNGTAVHSLNYGSKKSVCELAWSGDVVLENAFFAYPLRREALILKGINLHLKRSTVTAVMGSSGAGKSTIVQLLARFYEVILFLKLLVSPWYQILAIVQGRRLEPSKPEEGWKPSPEAEQPHQERYHAPHLVTSTHQECS